VRDAERGIENANARAKPPTVVVSTLGAFHPTNARPSSEATTSVTPAPLEIWIGA
jgi:hypothetical protein